MKTIFYYAYVGDSSTSANDIQWRLQYINEQMAFISTLARKNNIYSLFVVATIPEEHDSALIKIATEHNFCLYTKLTSRENCYEYPGFAAIRDFAESAHPDHLIYYCHSKGSVNISERARGVFKYHQVININAHITNTLETEKKFLKAGLYPSKTGFLWHNFFWIKAGYLKTKTIKKSSNRYYYESLIEDNEEGHKSVLCTLFIKPPREDFEILEYFNSSDILGKTALDIIYNEHIAIDIYKD